MSNLTTLPKGDSAWLLRKSIQRIMQQISVLETNIGSSTTGNSSDTQIIFNDAGTLRGDSGLTYNKTTDLLSVGSATITGALAANADTTLGTASKATNTNLNLSSDLGTQRIYLDRGTRSLVFQDVTSSIENYRIAGITGVHTWGVGGSTAMTLNSTGLGVGGSPTTGVKLHVGGGNAHIRNAAGGQTKLIFGPSANYVEMGGIIYDDTDGTLTFGTIQNYATKFITNNTERLRIDTSGNVGIGITPSTWATTTTVWRALDLQHSCGLASSGAGSGEIDLLWNAYYDQTDQRWEFKYTGDRASRYEIRGSGVHNWYNTASAGTANAAITWQQLMSLDVSGNLAPIGNLVPANGKGIDFSATSEGSGTMTSELLSDYEEGTFVANITGGTTNPTTPVTTTARYTKIGRQVTVQISFENKDTTGASGTFLITGLPFVSASGSTSTGSVNSYAMITFTGSLSANIGSSESYITMLASESGAVWNAGQHNAGASRYLNTTITYTV